MKVGGYGEGGCTCAITVAIDCPVHADQTDTIHWRAENVAKAVFPIRPNWAKRFTANQRTRQNRLADELVRVQREAVAKVGQGQGEGRRREPSCSRKENTD